MKGLLYVHEFSFFLHVLSIPLDRASTHVPHVYEEEYAQGIMHKAIILTTH